MQQDDGHHKRPAFLLPDQTIEVALAAFLELVREASLLLIVAECAGNDPAGPSRKITPVNIVQVSF